MKTKMITLLTTLCFFCWGCNTKGREENTSYKELTTITYDSCEYVKSVWTNNTLAHKGNCKFCAERKKLTERK